MLRDRYRLPDDYCEDTGYDEAPIEVESEILEYESSTEETSWNLSRAPMAAANKVNTTQAAGKASAAPPVAGPAGIAGRHKDPPSAKRSASTRANASPVNTRPRAAKRRAG